MIRRSKRPNPLLKHVKEYRKSSKSLLKLEPEEIKRLAHLQAEAFVNRPDINWGLDELIRKFEPS